MSKAIRSHGTQLQMGDGGTAGSAKTITSTAAGNPYTLVTATAHGFKSGDIVLIAGVTGAGATPVNGSRKVTKISADVFAVQVATTGAGSGGTATPSAEAFTKLAEVGDIKGPDLQRQEQDVTSHDSPLDYEEVMATIIKTGEVTFPIHWVPSDPTHDPSTGLYAALEDGDTRNWKLVATDDDVDPSTFSFAGFVNGFTGGFPVQGVITADLKIRVTGAPSLHVTGS